MLLKKFVPVTVICSREDDPADAEAGAMLFTVGGEPATGPVTVKVAALETLLSGFCTVTRIVPGLVSRLAGTSAVNWVEFTKPVLSGTAALPAAFHWTTEPEKKFVPVT